jgi:hypothetical protein
MIGIKMSEDSFSLTVIGDVLSLEMDGHTSKVKLPRGERGVAGRDGISIRGEKGDKGDKGDVPMWYEGCGWGQRGERGERGEKGDDGCIGKTPSFKIGTVVMGDSPAVILGGSVLEPELSFVLPRGAKGETGIRGKDGKHGTHEYAEIQTFGNSPRFTDEWFAKYVICDGVVELPAEMGESDLGRWFHVKSFDSCMFTGCMEGCVSIKKGESGRKFMVVPYREKYVFTAF